MGNVNTLITDSDRRYHDSVSSYVNKLSSVKDLRERGVWWFVESYLNECDFKPSLSKASHWAYILHDCDDCEPHYHILIHYSNSRTGLSVLRDFIGFQNTRVEKCISPLACYEYLTHKNTPEKYQYSSSRIVTHNPIYWEHFIPSIRDRTNDKIETDFIEDLLNSEKLDYYTMAKKYGRDFMKNWRSYIDFREEVLWQRRANGEKIEYK